MISQTVMEWLMEPPFSNPYHPHTPANFTYPAWIERGRKLPGCADAMIGLLEQEDLGKPSAHGVRAAYGLGWVGSDSARVSAALLRCNGSKSVELRFEAIAALGRMRSSSSVRIIEALAANAKEDVNVRGNALIALGNIAEPSSEPVLQAGTRDPDAFVARCATEGLKIFQAGGGRIPPQP